MTTTQPASETRGGTLGQVQMRTLQARRRRVWRSALMVVVVAVAMTIMASMNRDQAAIRSCRDRMDQVRGLFQEAYDGHLPCPPLVPRSVRSGDGDLQKIMRYGETQYNVLFQVQRDSGRKEVGLCCCRPPHRPLIGYSGRHVIVFKNNRYQLLWMPEAEFQRQAATLGLKTAGED